MTEHLNEHPTEHSSPTIGAHHHWHSESYVQDWIADDVTRDAQRRPLLRWATSLLPLDAAPSRVLDVGGGYGEFASQVLAQFPRASVCVQDYSAAMLDRARANLAEFGDRAQFQQSDLTDAGWTRTLNGPFDAAVSALAIHNLGTGAEIRPVYAAVYSLLRPGGWFFNLDLVLNVLLSPLDSPVAGLYRRATASGSTTGPAEHQHESGVIPAAPSLEDHLDWLRDAGFDSVDCVRKHLSEVFLVARRPS